MVLPVIFVSFILWKSLQTGGDVGAAFAVFGLGMPYTDAAKVASVSMGTRRCIQGRSTMLPGGRPSSSSA